MLISLNKEFRESLTHWYQINHNLILQNIARQETPYSYCKHGCLRSMNEVIPYITILAGDSFSSVSIWYYIMYAIN